MRHGGEPWVAVCVKMLMRWPNCYYATTAFAPKYYPKAIIDFANTRGADKIIYAGYFPMGLSIERMAIFPGSQSAIFSVLRFLCPVSIRSSIRL
jgi:predicted TIM-barrel fold metal-dependent hydrolase